MELDKIKFRVVCDYEIVIEKAIGIYNATYKTDFKLIEVIYDEVTLVEIEVSKYKISDIFSLGAMYSRMSAEYAKDHPLL
jgi:hypothetical protein